MTKIEEIEANLKQQQNQRDNKSMAQFMSDAIERGMAIPCHTSPASEDMQRNEKYR